MSQSVTRAAGILDSLAKGPLTIRELAEQFAVHRSTMLRELQALDQVGYVRRGNDGRYALGMRLIALAQRALSDIDLRQAAYAIVRNVHRRVGNTVHVTALLGTSLLYVDKVEDASGIRMASRPGSPVLPQCSAAGKAILATLDSAERDAILADVSWRKYTSSTLTSRAALDIELERTRVRGWASDQGEFEDFVNCVAVPVRTSVGVVGALSLTSLKMVSDLHALNRHIPLLQRAASEVAQNLG